MNQSRLINKLFAIVLMISLTLGCNFLTSLAGTESPLSQPTSTLSQGSEPGETIQLIVPATLEASPEEAAAALVDPNRVEAGVWFLLRGLGIGVYTGDGKQVLAGSETGPKDFWIYDFEIPLIVRLAMEPSRPFSEFQPQLHDLGLRPSLEETLKLYKDVYDANPSAYLVRLFEATGLQFEGDPEITPLQVWLLMLDTFLPPNPSAHTGLGEPAWMKSAGVGMLALPRQAAVLGPGVFTRPAQTAPCGWIIGGAFHANWGLVNSEIAAADMFVAETAYYAIHGPLLARSVRAEFRPDKDHAHEGHGTPGDTITFDVVVDTDYRVGGRLIPIGLPTCGYLLNFDPPLKSGELPPAKIWWSLGPGFKNHGSFNDVRGHVFDGSNPTETDPSGRTSITFQARQEPANGQGQEQSSRETVRASFDPRAWIAAMGLKDVRLLAFLPATIDILPSESVTLEWHQLGWKGAPYLPGDVVTGVVCDLEKPFTLHFENSLKQYNLDFQFTPNDQKHGSVSYSGQYNWGGGLDGMGMPDYWQPVSGDGFYDVTPDEDSGQPVLGISGWFDWNEPDVGRFSGTLAFAFLLVPLDTSECGQP